MCGLLDKLLRLVARTRDRPSRRARQDVHEREVQRWLVADGERTLRLDYQLGDKSIVFDVGGYQGDWASAIFERYNCTIHVFEPVPEFADQIRERFRGKSRIVIHELAMGDRSGTASISVAGDGSSLYQSSKDVVEVRLVRAADFMREHSIGRIDLMKINIEGGEYDLLGHLIAEDLVTKIGNIQVQFHPFVLRAGVRMRAIQEVLARTHELTYQYRFAWENWALKRRTDANQDATEAEA